MELFAILAFILVSFQDVLSDTECENKKLDVVFLMDKSRSIQEPDLKLLRSAVKEIVKELEISENGNHVGVITFGKEAKVEIHLDLLNDFNEISRVILAQRLPGFPGGTFTDKALEEAIKELEALSRKDARKMVVVLTDGKSSAPGSTAAIVGQLKRSNVTVFAIGVGKFVDPSELALIATGSADQGVYRVANFTELLSRTKTIAKGVCTAPEIKTILSLESCRMPCLKNGAVEGQSTAGSTVTFECEPGYVLSGSNSATCQSNGQWSVNVRAIKCVKDITCPAIVSLSNGKIVSNGGNKPNAQVKFECDSGFEMIGRDNMTCGSDGRWKGRRPVCRNTQCRAIKGLRNGDITKFTPTDGGTAEFKCRSGYIMIGPDNIQCKKGTWSHSKPRCVRKRCTNSFRYFRFGSVVEGVNAAHQETLNFTCHHGYKLNGPSEIFCDDHGQWSQCFPTCEREICPWYPMLDNGRIEKKGPDFVREMTFVCDQGYKLSEESGYLKCVDGEWDRPIPSCEEDMCPPISQFKNGRVSDYTRLPGSVVTFTCNKGYKLSDESSNSATCQGNREWTLIPSCVYDRTATERDNHCPTILEAKCTGSNVDGGSMTCSCDPGYALNGQSQLNCTKGTWSASVPRCKPNKCKELHQVKGGKSNGKSLIPGSKVTFQCDPGYTMEGASQLTCLQSQADSRPRWSSEQPKCRATRCRNLYRIKNGRANGSGDENGSKRTFTCEDGFRLDGAPEITCQDGKWTPDIPKCVRNTCHPVLYINHGQVIGNDFSVGKSIKITCDPGYKPDASVIKCTDQLWWTDKPRCLKNRCPSIATMRNGRIDQYSNMADSTSSVVCNKGFQLSGKGTIRCSSNAEWVGATPSCDPISKCPSLCLRRGNVKLDTRSLVRKNAQFSCDTGFELSGVGKAQCVAGNWVMRPCPKSENCANVALEMPSCVAIIPSECKGMKLDIIFLVDFGKNTRNRILDQIRSTVRLLVQRFTDGKVRVGLVTYDSDVHEDVKLGEHDDISSLVIDDILKRDTTTKGANLHLALAKLTGQFSDSKHQRIAVVIASGPSSEPDKTLTEAKKVKEAGISLFGLGVYKRADEEELSKIANDADSGVFIADRPEQLSESLREIAIQICNSQKSQPQV